jgi:hypothetical protein
MMVMTVVMTVVMVTMGVIGAGMICRVVAMGLAQWAAPG